VHFQSIVERFNPHDTEITITCPKELRDHALTSACSTHTATASISSSNSSLRQRRLTDIAESADEEEPLKAPISPGSLVPLGSTGEKGKGNQGLAVVVTAHDPKSSDGGPGSPVFLDEDGDHLISPRSSSFPGGEELRRKSTNSIRPSPSDIYGYPYTPKVRLGPRPHVESQKRPHTSSERSKTFPSPGEEVRPVASVPKSVQIAPRKSSTSSVGTKSLTSESVKSIPISPALGIPQGLPSPAASPPPPTILPPSPPQPEGPPVLSPEKQRLMRALQLRRQTMMPEVKEHVKPDDGTPPEDPLVNIKEKDEAKSIESEFEEDMASDKLMIQRKLIEASQKPIQDSKELDTNTDQGEINTEIGAGEQGSQPTEAENTGHRIHRSGGATSVTGDQRAESTKVRGEPESDVETESDQSVEVSIAESRPISVKPVQQPLPNVVKSIYHTPKPTSPIAAPSQIVSKVLKRAERPQPERPQPERVPPTEIPVIETARSVSAPFLKGRETTKPVVVRKVNVGGGGSVLQRIRQLEMLSVSEGGTAAPPISPPRSRNTSPTPAFPPRPVSVHSNTPVRILSSPPQYRASTSYVSPIRIQAAPAPESAPQDAASLTPPTLSSLPKIEIIERNNRPELQVTTTITRDEGPIALPSSSPPKVVDAPRNIPKERDNSSPLLDPSPTRRGSLDIGSTHSQNSSRRPSVDRPTPSRSSSSKDLQNLPEGRPSSTSSKKSKRAKSRRGSSSSSGSSHRPNKSPTTPKSPKSSSGFLRRMSSSLSKKTKEVATEVISVAAPTLAPAPAPTPVPEPAQSARKTYLLTGWINVQLPDTMVRFL